MQMVMKTDNAIIMGVRRNFSRG